MAKLLDALCDYANLLNVSCRIFRFSFQYKNVKIKTYRSVILSVVVYGCETWSLTMMEEQRLRVFEHKVLRKIFGPKMDEVIGEWRGLYILVASCSALTKYYSGTQIEKREIGSACGAYGAQ